MPVSARRLTRPTRLLLALALAVAALVGSVSLSSPTRAEASSPSPAAGAIRFGLAHLGDWYGWGAAGPHRFDCSGLTMRAYQSGGVHLPRTSRQQWYAGRHVRRSGWRPGDLVFWASNTRRPSTIHHVAIYLGGGMVLQAPHTGARVDIAPLWSAGLMARAVRPAATAHGLLSVSQGANGAPARVVQSRLRANGYAVSKDGTFGPETSRAVARFEEDHGYHGDSTVGARTWALLVAQGSRTHVS